MGIGDKSRYFNKNLVEFIEFGHMLDLANIIVNCAMNRTESRGAHFRTDYPKEDINFRKRTIAYNKNEEFQLHFEEIQW